MTLSTSTIISSIEEKNTIDLEESFVIVPLIEEPIPLPANFPPLSRNINAFKKKSLQYEKAESAHEGYFATYQGKEYYIKRFAADPENENSKQMAELEVACWMSYKLIVPNIVPNEVFPLYEYDPDQNQYHFVGVASQLIPGFIPNRIDPLKKEDLIAKSYQCQEAIKTLKELSLIETRPEETWYDWGKEKGLRWITGISSFFSPKTYPSAGFVKEQIDYFLAKDEINKQDAYSLCSHLTNRLEYLPQLIAKETEKNGAGSHSNKAYHKEKKFLQESLKQLHLFVTEKLLEIPQLRELNARVEKLGLLIDDEKCYLAEGSVLDTKITFAELRRYRLEKNLAQILNSSDSNEEEDLHNNNLAKKGRCDFDMTFWHRLLCKFKMINHYDWYKKTAQNSLPTWIRDLFTTAKYKTKRTILAMQNFPNNVEHRYWPTHSANSTSSAINNPSSVALNIIVAPFKQNFYRPSDGIAFQALQKERDFQFERLVTTLKSMLVTDEMHIAGNALCIRSDIQFLDPDDNEYKKTANTFAKIKITAYQEYQEDYLTSDCFKNFIKDYGHYAFNEIIKEFATEQELLKEKIKLGEKYYAPLVEAMDNKEEMLTKYNDILIKLGLPMLKDGIQNNLTMAIGCRKMY